MSHTFPIQRATQPNLQMGLLGITELTDFETLIFEVQMAQYMKDFYNERAGAVFDMVANVDVMDWHLNLEGGGSYVYLRFLQDSLLIVKYNTEMTY